MKIPNFKKLVKDEFLFASENAVVLSFSVAVGILVGVSPFWGWQTMIAVGLSVLFRLNKVITVTASFISIPPVIPFILYLSYMAGGMLLGNQWEGLSTEDITFDYVKANLIQYIVGAFLLGIVSGTVAGGITYVVIRLKRNGIK